MPSRRELISQAATLVAAKPVRLFFGGKRFFPPYDLLRLPRIGRGFRSSPYLDAAVWLQSLGPKKATEVLSDAVERDVHEPIFALCRMLFHNPRYFRGPALGEPNHIGKALHGWPLEPIHIQDGVPFSVTSWYNEGGFPESAAWYLNYCLGSCEWSPVRFQPATREQRIRALSNFLASDVWAEPPSDFARNYLVAQIA